MMKDENRKIQCQKGPFQKKNDYFPDYFHSASQKNKGRKQRVKGRINDCQQCYLLPINLDDTPTKPLWAFDKKAKMYQLKDIPGYTLATIRHLDTWILFISLCYQEYLIKIRKKNVRLGNIFATYIERKCKRVAARLSRTIHVKELQVILLIYSCIILVHTVNKCGCQKP